MANLVTLCRLIMLLVVVWLAYQPPGPGQLLAFFLLILMFLSDALDGYVARRRQETSLFGALFDIAGDRIVEVTLWIVFADLDLVPIWIPIVFVIRGVVVDTIRSSQSSSRGVVPFAVTHSAVGRFLVAGQFMRVSYAIVKACAFCGLVLLQPFPALFPEIWARVGLIWSAATYVCVYLAVALCVVRGLPVIAEFVHGQHAGITESSRVKR